MSYIPLTFSLSTHPLRDAWVVSILGCCEQWYSEHGNAGASWWCSSCSVVSSSCDPMDCSLPGSSVHWILQAGVLEWVAISFSSRYLLEIFILFPLVINTQKGVAGSYSSYIFNSLRYLHTTFHNGEPMYIPTLCTDFPVSPHPFQYLSLVFW